jgi:phosphoglycolate phosphatase-like HAD superfamily hydrolase
MGYALGIVSASSKTAARVVLEELSNLVEKNYGEDSDFGTQPDGSVYWELTISPEASDMLNRLKREED